MSTGTESGSPALNLEKCSVVLLDVAGTTTSLNFVKVRNFYFIPNICLLNSSYLYAILIFRRSVSKWTPRFVVVFVGCDFDLYYFLLQVGCEDGGNVCFPIRENLLAFLLY